jgi:hypothetical protein
MKCTHILCLAAQLEKVMKALFVRKLYLWPRFEAHVKETLNELPIQVTFSLP